MRADRSCNSKNRVIASNTKDYSCRIARRISIDSRGASSASFDEPFAFVLYSESLDGAFLRGGSTRYVRACVGKVRRGSIKIVIQLKSTGIVVG